MKTYRIRALVLASSLAVLLGLGVPPGATAKECKKSTFPATGQTTAYPANKNGNGGAVVPDDGTVRAGAALRYKDNGNGTITDENTGLIWEK